ncbi:MAG: hypothetical protein H6832_17110 [Planctomycetes bacterium]|nr:hypothetical protein [Planctomycetota bacterium]MCB9920123.1 hypothetical protein [Planctomycetota bacterium]
MMQESSIQHRDGERGSALVYATILSFVIGALVMSTTLSSVASTQRTVTCSHQLRAQFLAETALAVIADSIRTTLANEEAPTMNGTVDIDGVPVPFTVAVESTGHVETDAVGIRTVTDVYLVKAKATSARVVATANSWMAAQTTSLFQYAVFYENDLLITPSPPMTIRGRIHTNADLYIGSNTSAITLDTNHMRVAGAIRRRFEPDGAPTPSNPVRFRKWVENPFDPLVTADYESFESKDELSMLGVPSTTGFDSDFHGYDANGDNDFDDAGDWAPFEVKSAQRLSDATVPGHTTLRVGANGASRAQPPLPLCTDPFVADSSGDWEWSSYDKRYVPAVTPGTGTHSVGPMHAKAGLSILVAEDGSSFAAYAGGFDVTSSVASAVSIGTIYDYRQGGFSPVARIDMAALNASGVYPADGLLYVSHHGIGTGTSAKGVELHNASKLQADMTVATDGPIYLSGDFNTDTPVKAAVISDALNLLSNAWVNDPAVFVNATNTTYNVAVVTGDTPTGPGLYNGGLENLPRFHENWMATSAVCTLHGSIVVPWHSRYANAPFTYVRREPPVRDYRYDPDFNDITKLPPHAPRVVVVESIATW